MNNFLLIQVEIIGAKLFPLTYKIDITSLNSPLERYDLLEVKLNNHNRLAIMIDIAKQQDESTYPFEIKPARKADEQLSILQKNLLPFISNYYMQPTGISAQIFTPITQAKFNQSICTNELPRNRLHSLSTEQQKVLEFCKKRNLSLIFGATGSGKTEIYLHIIHECLTQNKQALFLMPEISLTPQIQNRLESAYPNLIGLWHSKQTSKQKKQVLQKLLSGEFCIIAGARSSLFLPYQNLGIIIVDEEHDDSYKSNSHPKYNAKDLAIFLSTKGVQVVLGSATPAVKDYYLAQKNNYLIKLESTFHNSQNTLIVDSCSNKNPISETIITALRNILHNKLQAIIFVPIRANFKSLLCRNCREKIMCPSCSITLSLHKKRNALVCHYCNFTKKIPKTCEYCGNSELEGFQLGTEEVKNHLVEIFQQLNISANIAIFDRDYITTQKTLEKTLSDFNKGIIDILIGTQMLAKGHDYHKIGLSVILGLDYMLAMQDYRAMEKTFSLMYQVGGRSGRKQNGVVIVQTHNRELISNFWGDYKLVIDHELHYRQFLYPPFVRLALVTFGNSNENIARELACEFADSLNEIQAKKLYDFEIVGICERNTAKLKNKFYYQVLLRAKSPLILQKAIQKAKQKASQKIIESIDIDIDPLTI
ncbi:replication restart helicase PriA [Helicobacter aurati]|nr:primosomal protein N' [Helicobacter aurati]